MELPTYKDISPTDGLNLDEALAAENFQGLSVVDAAVMISDNPSYYLNDFYHMGERGFCFYLSSIELCVSDVGVGRIFIERFEEIVNYRITGNPNLEFLCNDILSRIRSHW